MAIVVAIVVAVVVVVNVQLGEGGLRGIYTQNQ